MSKVILKCWDQKQTSIAGSCVVCCQINHHYIQWHVHRIFILNHVSLSAQVPHVFEVNFNRDPLVEFDMVCCYIYMYNIRGFLMNFLYIYHIAKPLMKKNMCGCSSRFRRDDQSEVNKSTSRDLEVRYPMVSLGHKKSIARIAHVVIPIEDNPSPNVANEVI